MCCSRCIAMRFFLPPSPPAPLPRPEACSGPGRGLESCAKILLEAGSSNSAGAGSMNPIEPIAAKAQKFSEMRRILMKRSHRSDLPSLQPVTRKKGSIFQNYVWPRTRICVPSWARGQGIAPSLIPPRSRIARIEAGQEGVPTLPMPHNEPGMSHGISRLHYEGFFRRTGTRRTSHELGEGERPCRRRAAGSGSALRLVIARR